MEYKKDLEHTKGHSINFCETPQFKNAAKMAQFTSDVRTTPPDTVIAPPFLSDPITKFCTALFFVS